MAPRPAAVVSEEDDDVPKTVPFKRTNDRIYPTRKTTLRSRQFVRRLISPESRSTLPITAPRRISEQAFNVLNQIEALPSGPFGPEHRLIIARNLALIQGVTADTVKEREEAERKRREIEEGVKRDLRVAYPDFLMMEDSEDEDEEEEVENAVEKEKNNALHSGGGGGGGGRGGRKRKRSSSEDDEDEEAQALKAKKARLEAIAQLQILEPVDIVTLAPLPTQINYPAHPTTDRPDAWFIDNFTMFYRQVEGTISHYYALHDIPLSSEPWLECKMTPEFLKWAEQVVEPNPRFGSWDELLRDKEMRKWFVMGVVMKVLKRKVFDKYLFGCGEVEEELFLQTDRAFLGREGFQREDVRAKLTSTLLGHASVPSLFYPSVAKLTAQVSLMLAPLTTYLYSLPPPAGKPAPKVSALYQSLHNLVSQAAYLSICCKITPSVIQIHDLRPGDQWQPDDMASLDTDGYIDSRAVITEDYKQEVHNLKAYIAKVKKEMDSLMPPLVEGIKTTKCEQAIAEYHKYLGILAEKTRCPPTYTHRALVKISVWPIIRRYTPGSEEEFSDQRIPLREKDGFQIFLLGKGAVIPYFGRENKIGDEYCSLPEWIGMKKRQADERLSWMGTVGKGGLQAVKIFGTIGVGTAAAAAGLWFDSLTGGVLVQGLRGVELDGVREFGSGLVSGLGGYVEGSWDTTYQSLVQVAELGGQLKWS